MGRAAGAEAVKYRSDEVSHLKNRMTPFTQEVGALLAVIVFPQISCQRVGGVAC